MIPRSLLYVIQFYFTHIKYKRARYERAYLVFELSPSEETNARENLKSLVENCVNHFFHLPCFLYTL